MNFHARKTFPKPTTRDSQPAFDGKRMGSETAEMWGFRKKRRLLMGAISQKASYKEEGRYALKKKEDIGRGKNHTALRAHQKACTSWGEKNQHSAPEGMNLNTKGARSTFWGAW